MCDMDQLSATDVNELAQSGMSADRIVRYLLERGTDAEVVEGFYPVGIQINKGQIVYPPTLQPL